MPRSATELLQQVRAGERQATEELLPLVYEELRKLARARLAREAPGQTLQPTALVAEGYVSRALQLRRETLPKPEAQVAWNEALQIRSRQLPAEHPDVIASRAALVSR